MLLEGRWEICSFHPSSSFLWYGLSYRLGLGYSPNTNFPSRSYIQPVLSWAPKLDVRPPLLSLLLFLIRLYPDNFPTSTARGFHQPVHQLALDLLCPPNLVRRHASRSYSCGTRDVPSSTASSESCQVEKRYWGAKMASTDRKNEPQCCSDNPPQY